MRHIIGFIVLCVCVCVCMKACGFSFGKSGRVGGIPYTESLERCWMEMVTKNSNHNCFPPKETTELPDTHQQRQQQQQRDGSPMLEVGGST